MGASTVAPLRPRVLKLTDKTGFKLWFQLLRSVLVPEKKIQPLSYSLFLSTCCHLESTEKKGSSCVCCLNIYMKRLICVAPCNSSKLLKIVQRDWQNWQLPFNKSVLRFLFALANTCRTTTCLPPPIPSSKYRIFTPPEVFLHPLTPSPSSTLEDFTNRFLAPVKNNPHDGWPLSIQSSSCGRDLAQGSCTYT